MGACQIHSPRGMQMQQKHPLLCWWQCIPIILVLEHRREFWVLGKHNGMMPHVRRSSLFLDFRYKFGGKWSLKSQESRSEWWKETDGITIAYGDRITRWNFNFNHGFSATQESISHFSQAGALYGLICYCCRAFLCWAQNLLTPAVGFGTDHLPSPKLGMFLQQGFARVVTLHWPCHCSKAGLGHCPWQLRPHTGQAVLLRTSSAVKQHFWNTVG